MLLNGNTKVSRFVPSKNSKSKWNSSVGIVTLLTASINVLPMHMRCPPRKGLKLKGLRGVPRGVKKYGLAGLNRSGINFSGSIHSSGLFPSLNMSMEKNESLRNVSLSHLHS